MSEKMDPMQKVITRCWEDEEFKKRLLANPGTVLKEEGLELPEDVMIKVIEDTAQTIHLVIPPNPSLLSDEELALAGGKNCWVNHRAF